MTFKTSCLIISVGNIRNKFQALILATRSEGQLPIINTKDNQFLIYEKKIGKSIDMLVEQDFYSFIYFQE